MKYLLSILLILASFSEINAQIEVQSYIDVGENNVSEGVFIKNTYRGSYQFQEYNVGVGMQFDLHSNNPNTFTGIDIVGSREFSIKDFPFDVKGFFMLNRFSDLMYETNWGFRFETRKYDHFLYGLGTNFKTYAINSSAKDEYNLNDSDLKLSENFNLIYIITAYLKPHYNDWNVGLTCTNVDYYIINQSTNPVFNLQGTYKLKSDLTFYLEAWNKPAGVFNISANHFGYFFRGGVKWEI